MSLPGHNSEKLPKSGDQNVIDPLHGVKASVSPPFLPNVSVPRTLPATHLEHQKVSYTKDRNILRTTEEDRKNKNIWKDKIKNEAKNEIKDEIEDEVKDETKSDEKVLLDENEFCDLITCTKEKSETVDLDANGICDSMTCTKEKFQKVDKYREVDLDSNRDCICSETCDNFSETRTKHDREDKISPTKLTEIINSSIKEAMQNIVKQCKMKEDQDADKKPKEEANFDKVCYVDKEGILVKMKHEHRPRTTRNSAMIERLRKNNEQFDNRLKSNRLREKYNTARTNIRKLHEEKEKPQSKKDNAFEEAKKKRHSRSLNNVKTDNRRMTGNVNIYICSEASENIQATSKQDKSQSCTESCSETTTEQSKVSSSKLITSIRNKRRKFQEQDSIDLLVKSEESNDDSTTYSSSPYGDSKNTLKVESCNFIDVYDNLDEDVRVSTDSIFTECGCKNIDNSDTLMTIDKSDLSFEKSKFVICDKIEKPCSTIYTTKTLTDSESDGWSSKSICSSRNTDVCISSDAWSVEPNLNYRINDSEHRTLPIKTTESICKYRKRDQVLIDRSNLRCSCKIRRPYSKTVNKESWMTCNCITEEEEDVCVDMKTIEKFEKPTVKEKETTTICRKPSEDLKETTTFVPCPKYSMDLQERIDKLKEEPAEDAEVLEKEKDTKELPEEEKVLTEPEESKKPEEIPPIMPKFVPSRTIRPEVIVLKQLLKQPIQPKPVGIIDILEQSTKDTVDSKPQTHVPLTISKKYKLRKEYSKLEPKQQAIEEKKDKEILKEESAGKKLEDETLEEKGEGKAKDMRKAEKRTLEEKDDSKIIDTKTAEGRELKKEDDSKIIDTKTAEGRELKKEDDSKIIDTKKAEERGLKKEDDRKIKGMKKVEKRDLKKEDDSKIIDTKTAEGRELKKEDDRKIKGMKKVEKRDLKKEDDSKIKDTRKAEERELKKEDDSKIKDTKKAEERELKKEDDSKIKDTKKAEEKKLEKEGDSESKDTKIIQQILRPSLLFKGLKMITGRTERPEPKPEGFVEPASPDVTIDKTVKISEIRTNEFPEKSKDDTKGEEKSIPSKLLTYMPKRIPIPTKVPIPVKIPIPMKIPMLKKILTPKKNDKPESNTDNSKKQSVNKENKNNNKNPNIANSIKPPVYEGNKKNNKDNPASNPSQYTKGEIKNNAEHKINSNVSKRNPNKTNLLITNSKNSPVSPIQNVSIQLGNQGNPKNDKKISETQDMPKNREIHESLTKPQLEKGIDVEEEKELEPQITKTREDKSGEKMNGIVHSEKESIAVSTQPDKFDSRMICTNTNPSYTNYTGITDYITTEKSTCNCYYLPMRQYNNEPINYPKSCLKKERSCYHTISQESNRVNPYRDKKTWEECSCRRIIPCNNFCRSRNECSCRLMVNCVNCYKPENKCNCKLIYEKKSSTGYMKSMFCLYCDKPRDKCTCMAITRKCSYCELPTDMCMCKEQKTICDGRPVLTESNNDRTMYVTAWKPREEVRRYFSRNLTDLKTDSIINECRCCEKLKQHNSDDLPYQRLSVFSDVMDELQQKIIESTCCARCQKVPCCCNVSVERDERREDRKIKYCISPKTRRKIIAVCMEKAKNKSLNNCKYESNHAKSDKQKKVLVALCCVCKATPCRCKRSKSSQKKLKAKCYYCKNSPCICIAARERNKSRPCRCTDSPCRTKEKESTSYGKTSTKPKNNDEKTICVH